MILNFKLFLLLNILLVCCSALSTTRSAQTTIAYYTSSKSINILTTSSTTNPPTTAYPGDYLTVSTVYLLDEVAIDGEDQPLHSNNQFQYFLLPNYTRLYTFVATISTGSNCVGLIASASNDYMLTSSTNCKCSTSPGDGYTQLGFDDSSWTSAFEYGRSTDVYCGNIVAYPTVSANAKWIWSSNNSVSREVTFCRCYSNLCAKQNPCQNGGVCNQNSEKICTCTDKFSGRFCELVKELEVGVTAKDLLIGLYVDGIQISPLVNADNWNMSMKLNIDQYSRLIAISAYSDSICEGILASVDSENVSTNSQWKCSPTNFANWYSFSYDDSKWPNASVVGDNTNGLTACPYARDIAGISPTAKWIWTNDSANTLVYCRGHLPACSYNPCVNGGQCSNTATFLCRCLPGFQGKYCEIAIDVRLSITALTRLGDVFLDGARQFLRYSNDSNNVDTLYNLDPLTRSVTVFADAAASPNSSCIGILGDMKMLDANNTVLFLTDNNWKCIDSQKFGWYELGYSFSGSNATIIGDNGALPSCNVRYFSEINSKAKWIWYKAGSFDVTSFCTAYLPVCDSKPCQNGGVCTSTGPLLCQCYNGYTGRFCEIPPSAMTTSVESCGTHGYHIIRDNKIKCKCANEFTGDRCHIKIENCNAFTCNFHGECIKRSFGISCICEKKFSGLRCEIEK